MKRILISLIATLSIFHSVNVYSEAAYSNNAQQLKLDAKNEAKNASDEAYSNPLKEFNWIIYDLLQDYKSADKGSKLALDHNYTKEFARQQCKKLNILEDMVRYTDANESLDKTDAKAFAVNKLKSELQLMQQGNVTKQDVCNWIKL